MTYRQMGQRIQSARIDAGFETAEEFADGLGKPVATVRSWEQGRTRPRHEDLYDIAQITERGVGYFYGEEAADVAETVRRLERLLGAGAVQSVQDAGGFARVPVYGRVAAGEGGVVDQQPTEYRHIPVSWIPQGQAEDCILIEATGDSMTDVGIGEGDLLLACPNVELHDGDIAVVQTSEDVTVKRVYLRDDGLMLVSANSQVPPRVVPRDEVRWIARVMWWRHDA